MKKLKYLLGIFFLIASFFGCSSDEVADNSFLTDLDIAVRGVFRLQELTILEEGQSDVDVTPNCPQEITITEDTYQENIQQGIKCQDEIISETYSYTFTDDLFEVVDEDDIVLFLFTVSFIDSDTMMFRQNNINGNINLSAQAIYTRQ